MTIPLYLTNEAEKFQEARATATAAVTSITDKIANKGGKYTDGGASAENLVEFQTKTGDRTMLFNTQAKYIEGLVTLGKALLQAS